MKRRIKDKVRRLLYAIKTAIPNKDATADDVLDIFTETLARCELVEMNIKANLDNSIAEVVRSKDYLDYDVEESNKRIEAARAAFLAVQTKESQKQDAVWTKHEDCVWQQNERKAKLAAEQDKIKRVRKSIDRFLNDE